MIEQAPHTAIAIPIEQSLDRLPATDSPRYPSVERFKSLRCWTCNLISAPATQLTFSQPGGPLGLLLL